MRDLYLFASGLRERLDSIQSRLAAAAAGGRGRDLQRSVYPVGWALGLAKSNSYVTER